MQESQGDTKKVLDKLEKKADEPAPVIAPPQVQAPPQAQPPA